MSELSVYDLASLLDQFVDLEEPDRQVDLKVAQMMGWGSIQRVGAPYRWVGINPLTSRFEDVPFYTKSIEAALSTKPDKWVITWAERFNDTHSVTLHPRGDLFLKPTQRVESPHPAIAICTVSIDARIQQMTQSYTAIETVA